jgi:hypothetical protein
MIFKRPHNYSQRYFELIFLPILKFGILSFFKFLDEKLNLSDQQLLVLPEKQRSDSQLFLWVDGYQIFLRGKADLRLETAQQKYIFDYKTGSNNPSKKKRFEDQLIIYEELYYLLKDPQLTETVKSYLYFVEKADEHKLKVTRKKPKEIILKDFESRIEQVVSQIIKHGFYLSDRAAKYENLEITRRDLFNCREK